jgi:hypothetical protein
MGAVVLSLVACTSSQTPAHAGSDAGVAADAGVDAGPVQTPDAGPPMGDAGTPLLLITSATPPSGPTIGGTVVVLLGSGFTTGFPQGGPQASLATTVTVGPNSALPGEVSVIDDSTLQFTVPPGDVGPADITVSITGSLGTVSGTCAGCFTYYQSVTLTAITAPSPAQGSTLGGSPFTLTGSGFAVGQLVLFGDAEASDINVMSGTTLTGLTPAGQAGAADVAVISGNSSAFLRLGWVFVAPMQITGVSPNGSPLAGGGTATISGSGFTPDVQVSFGGVAAQPVTWVSAETITVPIPMGSVAGPVDVLVVGSRSQADLPNGFAWYDSSSNLQLYAVSPQQGPVAGGTCAAGTGCLHLVGSGFPTDGSLQIAVGGNRGAVNVTGGNTADVDLPMASGPGIVDIQARTAAASASLPSSFAYVNPLTVSAVTPSSGPATGSAGTSATVSGTGFASTCQIQIGAGAAAIQSVRSDGTSAVITLPDGSTGPADVVVTCGTPGSLSFQTATLAGGFTYTAPLQILQVSPDSGAIAGNTAVSVYGNGFATGMQVFFGSAAAADVQVLNAYEASVRTPPGNVGFVDVKVTLGSASAVLPGAFGYYDPKNSTGGASGGPMQGILNVTLLDQSYTNYGNPVPNATISINNDALTGTTDANGQVTFSDPSLLKPVSITAVAAGFETVTVAQVDARDVTLYTPELDPVTPPPCVPPNCPPPPQPATFQGTVCGFKLPPQVAADPTQLPEAQIYFTYPYVYAAPPFGSPETPVIVTSDCGSWTMQTYQFGATAIYAVFGTLGSDGTFTPYLMTVASGLQSVPQKTVNVPLILNMHLDVTVPIAVQIDEPPAPRPPVTNNIYSYLDLGGEGVVPLGQATANTNDFMFPNHPDVSGQSLIFLDYAFVSDQQTSLSLYYRRQQGDLAAGVTIGPMLPFTTLVIPQSEGVFTGSLGWEFGMGPQPDLQYLQVYAPDGSSAWSVVLPGAAQAASLPPSALAAFPMSATGGLYTWSLVTASSPRFEYDYFSYDQLGINAWTAFTQNEGLFLLP